MHICRQSNNKMKRLNLNKQTSSYFILEKFLSRMSSVTIFFIAIIISSQTSSVLGDVEWPVYFEHLGFVHSVHNKWELALSVNFYLPKLDLRLGKSMHRLRLLQGRNYDGPEEEEEPAQYRDIDPEELAREARVLDDIITKEEREARASDHQPSRLHELQESWATLNRHLRQRCKTLRRRSNNLKGLGSLMPPRKRSQRYRRDAKSAPYPTFGDEIVPSIFRNFLIRDQAKRQKRQDDGGDGGSDNSGLANGVFKSVFGLAYDEDVNALIRRLNELKGEYQSGIQTVETQQSQLRSLTSSELKSTKTNMNKVMKMADKLDRKVQDMETNPFLRSPIGNIVRSRTEIYNNLQLELDLVETRLAEIERMVTTLSAGRLDKNLLAPKKLRTTLQSIERQLPQNYTLLFSPNEALWPYYSLLSATASFDERMEGAMIHLSIPLIDLGAIMDLHRVHNLPLKVKDGYSVTADIETEYLVTDTTRNYFLELNKDDFQDCQIFHYKGGDHFYCGFGPMLRADDLARSCVMQLYQGTADPTWCQSNLRHGLIQPFTRLYNGSWIFAALHDRFNVELQCPDSITPTSLMGFGVISLADGCTITSHEFWYPHTLTGVIDVKIDFGDKNWDHANFHTDESIHDMMNGSHPRPPKDEFVDQNRNDQETSSASIINTVVTVPSSHDDHVSLQDQVSSIAVNGNKQAVVISNGLVKGKRSTMMPEDSTENSSTEDPGYDISTSLDVNEMNDDMVESRTTGAKIDTSSSTPRLLLKDSAKFQKQALELAEAALQLDGDTMNQVLDSMSEKSERKYSVGDLEAILATAALSATSTEQTNTLNNMIVKLSESPQTKWLFSLK